MAGEGTIKFRYEWKETGPFPEELLADLNEWRQRLYEAGLIGKYKHNPGLGMGNVSKRLDSGFIITGSRTGVLERLDGIHYVKILSCDFEENSAECEGPIEPSSESLTHGSFYCAEPGIKAVVHCHNPGMWKSLYGKMPTTSENAGFGSAELCREIFRFFRDSGLKEKGMLVSGGEEDGILSFGRSLDEAGGIMMECWKRYR